MQTPGDGGPAGVGGLGDGLGAGAGASCWCHACAPDNVWPFRLKMIVCPDCGNKRCPKASDHALACTNSNAPGQPGRVYGGLCDWPHCDCNDESPVVVDGSECWRGLPRQPKAPNVANKLPP